MEVEHIWNLGFLEECSGGRGYSGRFEEKGRAQVEMGSLRKCKEHLGEVDGREEEEESMENAAASIAAIAAEC